MHLKVPFANANSRENGTILSSVDKVVNTIQNVKWKNVNLKAIFMDKEYQKGIKLSDKEMKEREPFLDRNKALEKWDVWIKPSFEMGTLFFE
jgi:Rhodopirellula transposase DDE domain